MREIDARVIGFDYTTFHAYTTEVEVDGCTWTLAIRYNTFYQFYTRLIALEKHFTADFPPKGGLFFSPPPEERQEQLDDFLLSTLAYFDMRGHPKRMEALLGELLQISEHLGIKDDDGERTASEGSSVAEELLLDTPIAGHDDHDDFLVSGDEDEDKNVHEDNKPLQEDNQVEDVEVDLEDNQSNPQEARTEDDHEDEEVAPVELETKSKMVEAELEEKLPVEVPEVKVEEGQVAKVMPSPKSDKAKPLQRQQSHELTGGAVAKDYIAMLRRRSLVNGAIQAAVVSTMKENVRKSKAAKAETAEAEEQKPIEEIKPTEAEELNSVTEVDKLDSQEPEASTEVEEQSATPIVEDNLAAPEELVVQTEAIPVELPTAETPVPVLEVTEDVATAPKEEVHVVEVLEPVVLPTDSPIEADLEKTPTTEPEEDTAAQESASASDSEKVEPAAPALDSEEAEPAAPTTPVESVQDDESSSEEESEEAVPEPSKKEAESENPVMSWFRRMGTFGPSSSEKEEQEAAAKKKQEEMEAAAAIKKDQEEAAARATAEAKAKSEAEAKVTEAAEAELLRAEQELNLRLQPYRHPVFFQGFNCDVGTSRYSLPQRVSDGIVV